MLCGSCLLFVCVLACLCWLLVGWLAYLHCCMPGRVMMTISFLSHALPLALLPPSPSPRRGPASIHFWCALRLFLFLSLSLTSLAPPSPRPSPSSFTITLVRCSRRTQQQQV